MDISKLICTYIQDIPNILLLIAEKRKGYFGLSVYDLLPLRFVL